MMRSDITSIVESGKKHVLSVHKQIAAAQEDDPVLRFETAPLTNAKGKVVKHALLIDRIAEKTFANFLRKDHGDIIFFQGEESLLHGLQPSPGQVGVLADMLDGTDLWEMGVDLWCTAAIFYDVDTWEILSSYVYSSDGNYFTANKILDRALIEVENKKPKFPGGPSTVKQLRDARIAIYGQKRSRVLESVKQQRFLEYLKKIDGKKHPNFRYYNFAGNPMIVKMINRMKNSVGKTVDPGIDAVVEYCGQKPHDIAPGAFIALKEGAVLIDLDSGEEIDIPKLGLRLQDNNKEIRYVIAATKALAKEIYNVFSTHQFT